MPAPKNPAPFTTRARAIHGDKYTYTHTAEPQNIQKTRLTIVCPTHGAFEQMAYVHLRGLGCKQCGKDAAAAAQRQFMAEKGATFVERARAIHGNRYDYSQTVYAGTVTDCTIICPEHGPFLQTAGNHLQGQHCGVCARRTAHSKTRHDINVFVERARATHGDKYDYSHAEYRGSTAKLTIVCPEHGAFDQVANQHIFGCGCPACGALAGGDAVRVTQAEWLERAKLVHSDLYDYSEVLYVNMHSKVGINCKKHGAFHQAAHSHLEGYGCPSCGYTISEAEREMVAFFESHGVEAQLGVAIGKQRVDVYLPHFHIAVEHDGEYFHSDLLPASIDPNDPKPGQRAGKYHKEKADAIAEHGVRVLQVWGTQWAHRRSLVEAILLRACGLGDMDTEHARKLTVARVHPREANQFFDKYHVQGDMGAVHHAYGLYAGTELVACIGMQNDKKKECVWELRRYASKLRIQGGLQRLVQTFRRAHPGSIVTKCDPRLFTGSSYVAAGFVAVSQTDPDYTVWHASRKRHWQKSAWARRNIATRCRELGMTHLLPYNRDPEVDPRTEKFMQDACGARRMFGNGLVKWVLK